MAEVAYGFFEAVEEINFPRMESADQLNGLPVEENAKREGNFAKLVSKLGVLRNFFDAMEKVNFSQMESSGSLLSMSSCASMSSMQSENGSVVLVEGQNPAVLVMNAVEKLTLNSYSSTNSLQSLDEAHSNSRSSTASWSPDAYKQLLSDVLGGKNTAMVAAFFSAMDKFMHNNDHLEEGQDNTGEERYDLDSFPKFC